MNPRVEARPPRRRASFHASGSPTGRGLPGGRRADPFLGGLAVAPSFGMAGFFGAAFTLSLSAPSLGLGGSTTILTQRQALLPALTGLCVHAQVQAPLLTMPPAQLILGSATVGLSGFGSTTDWTQRQAFLPALTGLCVRSHTQAPSLTHVILGSTTPCSAAKFPASILREFGGNTLNLFANARAGLLTNGRAFGFSALAACQEERRGRRDRPGRVGSVC
jgi:hypothetical protein